MEQKNNTAFDLSTLDVIKFANVGTAVDILHPVTKEPLGFSITVLGSDGAAFKKISIEQARRRLAKMEKNGGFKPSAVSQEEREEDAVELLAACTTSWTKFNLEGANPSFNFDNAVALYSRFPWLREQVDQAIGNRANFIKG